jgi:hypothetical protein
LHSVLTTEGLDIFQYWRGGKRVETFEPGMEHTRPKRTELWWGRVEAALPAHKGEEAGMVNFRVWRMSVVYIAKVRVQIGAVAGGGLG